MLTDYIAAAFQRAKYEVVDHGEFCATVPGPARQADRCFFMLDDKAFKRFTNALDKSPADNPRLRRLLATTAPWK